MMFAQKKSNFDIKTSVNKFLIKYNEKDKHSTTGVVPKELFDNPSDKLKE